MHYEITKRGPGDWALFTVVKTRKGVSLATRLNTYPSRKRAWTAAALLAGRTTRIVEVAA
jgi:hypothetical protein